MKTPRKLLISLTILVLSASTVLAQRGGGGPRGGGGGGGGSGSPAQSGGGANGGQRQQPTPEQRKQRADNFAEKVELSAAQKSQMADLQKQKSAALKTVRDDATLTKDQQRAKVKEIEQSFRDKDKAVLTPEQQAKAEELRKQQKGKHDDKPPAAPTGG